MKNYKGFTLIELLIASTIFMVLAVTVYSAFHTGIFGYRNIEETIDVYQAARLILERLDLDLRNSFVYSDAQAKFSGNKNEVSFLTLVDTYREDKLLPEYAFVSYKLEANKLLRLCRKNQESLKEKSEVQPDEMATNIKELSFNFGYLDPVDSSLKFKDSWGSTPDEQKTLPMAVKVNLTLKGKAGYGFERTIFLP